MESPDYKSAHRGANAYEKSDYPKQYEKMKSVDAHLPAGQYAGTHNQAGEIEISKRVPLSLRNDVADHEYYEHLLDPGKCAVCKKNRYEHT